MDLTGAGSRCNRHQQCDARRFGLTTSAKSSNRSGVNGCVSTFTKIPPQLSVAATAFPQHATVLPVPHLQVKNVPDDVYAALRERAAAARSTVRDYVLDLVEEDLARPSVTSWLDEVRASRPARVPGRWAIADALDGAADEIEGLGGR